jgi:hypothetical protein
VAWLVDQQEADGGFELADFPGFETPDAVFAIAQQAQVEPAWNATLARDVLDAMVSSGGNTPLDHLDDAVEALIEGSPDDTPEEVAARGAQLAKILALVILPLRGTPGIAITDFDPSGDSDDPVNVRPTILASQGDGTFSTMNFNGRLYVMVVQGTADNAPLIASVKAAQQPNGAWNFAGTPSGSEVDADTTGLAIQGLVAVGVDEDDTSIHRGLAALARSQQASGAWQSFGAEDPNSTAMATLGIRAAGGDPNTPCWREAVDDRWAGVPYVDPADWLRDQQAGDGHIASPSDEFGLTTFATSQAVQAILGLSPLFDHLSPEPPACATSVPDEERFVHAVYVGLLGRLADGAGTTFHADRLRAGATPTSVVRSLTGSGEYRRRVVDGFYRAYLDRPGDRGGLAHFSSSVLTRRVSVQAALLGSNEYFSKAGGTNEGFVDALFRDVLGRSADGGARTTFVAQLAFGRSRGAVARTVLTSREALGDLVDDLYEHHLRRAPDRGGRTYWRDRLAAGTRVETVVAALAGSSEYVSATAAS